MRLKHLHEMNSAWIRKKRGIHNGFLHSDPHQLEFKYNDFLT